MNEKQQIRDQANREELSDRIAQVAVSDGAVSPLEGLFLHRASRPSERGHGVSKLAFCVIAQGAKEVYLGDQTYRYDSRNYLLTTVELPVMSQITEASPESPYLSMRLEISSALVGSVMLDAGIAAPQGRSDSKAFVVSDLDSDLLDASVRLLRCLDMGSQAPTMGALVSREIVLRLLLGEQSGRLRHIPPLSGYTQRISRAVEKMRKDFDKPLRVESLAKELGMSSSGFHLHFKAVTDMSPLQFQKQIRLQEARRLLLDSDVDAATAGFKVGYEDASHFGRDYKRLFGHPPAKDAERLRTMVAVE